jgi:hypothetical protein
VTAGAFQTTAVGSLWVHGFVTLFDPTLSSLLASTYFTAGKTLRIHDVHLDNGGIVTISGVTQSPYMPVTEGAFDTTHNGYDDAFVARLAPDLSRLFYSTYIGGSLFDTSSIGSVPSAVDSSGTAAVGMGTTSVDAPVTTNALQSVLLGDSDTFLARLDLLPTGVSKFGSSTPGGAGPLSLGVTAMPRVGSETFAVTCSGAPPTGPSGFLLVGLGGLTEPVSGAGTAVWVDPATLVSLLPMKSQPVGYSELKARIPDDQAAVGLAFVVQSFWIDHGAASGWSASNALEIVLQP